MEAALAFKLKDDIIALVDLFAKHEAERRGMKKPLADSSLSREIFGHANTIIAIRNWTGGPKSQTLESIARIEVYIQERIGENAYQEFLRNRASI